MSKLEGQSEPNFRQTLKNGPMASLHTAVIQGNRELRTHCIDLNSAVDSDDLRFCVDWRGKRGCIQTQDSKDVSSEGTRLPCRGLHRLPFSRVGHGRESQ